MKNYTPIAIAAAVLLLALTLAAPAPPVHAQAPGCDFVPADILSATPALSQTTAWGATLIAPPTFTTTRDVRAVAWDGEWVNIEIDLDISPLH